MIRKLVVNGQTDRSNVLRKITADILAYSKLDEWNIFGAKSVKAHAPFVPG